MTNQRLRRYSMNYAIKMNEREPCRVKGCENSRYHVSYYCLYHLNRKKRTGHPEGKLIPRSHFYGMRELTAKVIRLNRKHRLITEALGWIDTLLFRTTRTGDPRLNRKANFYCRNVVESGYKEKFDAANILALLSAVALAHWGKGGSWFHDDGEYNRNVATRFIRFGKLDGHPLQPQAVKKLERLLDKKLGYAMLRIARAAEKLHEEDLARHKELKMELVIED